MTTDPALAALARVRAAVKRSDRRPVVRPPRLTGAGPDERDPQELGALLERWVAGTGAGADLAVAGLAARWEQIVGPQIAAHTTLGDYRPDDGGDLVVHADTGQWAVQLRYLTDRITERIAAEIGPGLVTRITVRGPQRPASAAGGWRVRTGRRSPRPAPVEPPPPDTLDLG